MSTAIWPPIRPELLEIEEKRVLANELAWLLASLRTTLLSLKSGFQECSTLLSPTNTSSISTLPLSTPRSETLKGILTRTGARLTSGSIRLRLPTLPPPKNHARPDFPLAISSAPDAPVLLLPQIREARERIAACLDVVDAAIWAGDARDAAFIAGQLRLLDVNISEARGALRGGDADVPDAWCAAPTEERVFEPPLPATVAFHVHVLDAALVVEIRTLEAAGSGAGSGFSFGGRLGAVLLGAAQPAAHDEMDRLFVYRGREVRVREKVRVESQDPILMAAMVKLAALERSVAHARAALDVVMGREES